MTNLSVTAWPDPIIDTLGHDPRSAYVERFWLPTLGPTTLLLLRQLASHLDQSPEGIDLDAAELSQSLGLGAREGASSPLYRSFDRLVQFDLACSTQRGTYAVRRSVPPVNRRHIQRLPDSLQRAHDDWIGDRLTSTPLKHARRRARGIAFTLFEQGDDIGQVEHRLLGIGFHPTVCRESAEWAHDRHAAALAALTDTGRTDVELGVPSRDTAA